MFAFKSVLGLVALLPLAQLAAAQAQVWGQCGGQGWTGATTCVSGSTCVLANQWYSQCQPGAVTTPPTTTTPGGTAPPSTTTTTTAPNGLESIPAGQLYQISNFGSNPNNVAMYVYKPRTLASKPALLVASHYCSGTAQAYYSGSKFAQLAETYGYVVLFPSSPRSGTCWDVSSDATLKHDGGGDSLGIASAVRYAIASWGVDAARVYAVGTSSGAMMTNVLAGAYPDLFKGAVVDSGVPFGCFAVPGQPSGSWNSQCAQGQTVLTGMQWAQKVYDAYPGYTGGRPKVQVWHGTADTTLAPQNFYEQVKQWTTVFGYSSTPLSNTTSAGLPSNYYNATFGPMFQAILAQGVGHTVPLYEQMYLQFLGIA
ncbi:acetyl xylan esterase [Daedaleopsis nitida]|nr:acetyl xylan esterase [Daedaleopsis nitida]